MAIVDREHRPGYVETYHVEADKLTRQFRDSIDLMHQILADIPSDELKVLKHIKRLKGYGQESLLRKDLAALGHEMLKIFTLSLKIPPGFYMELTLTPSRFNASDLRDTGYANKQPMQDSMKHIVNVGIPHQEGNLLKRLSLDLDVLHGFPHFVLRETINDGKGKDRLLGVNDLLGIKVRFPTKQPLLKSLH